MRNLRFDDKGTREERRKMGKLAAVREFFDAFVKNCQNCYTLSEFVTIDEMLVAFRGRCSWIQYTSIPSKPAKYGVKMFAMCDAKPFYSSNLEVYVGKQPPGPFDVSNTPMEIVKRLVNSIEKTNRNLTTDNWYTSLPLAYYLFEKNITTLGTLKKYKKEIPPEFQPNKKNIPGSCIYGFQKNMTLLSYSTMKNKSVILISTMHDNEEIDEETKRPRIIVDYNATKCGVDIVDKMCATYSVSRITRRWPMIIFFACLNIAGINAQVIL